MSEVFKYIKDPRFFLPMGFLVLVEAFLQTGLYNNLMQPRSYADNVRRITTNVRASKLKPDILVLGTSVAYQGVNPRRLNEKLSDVGIVTQSAACEGAKLFTQHMLYKSVKSSLPSVKIVMHVSEVTFPWTARYNLDDPNRSMINQMSRAEYLPLLKQYQMRLTSHDWFFFYVRSITYQRDLRDFVLDPLDRFKGISRRFKEPHSDYVYENTEEYAISAYSTKSLDDCMSAAARDWPAASKSKKCFLDSSGKCVSDGHHQTAVLQTCHIGKIDPMVQPGGDQWTRLYFSRMKILVDEIRADGREIVIVFPPYSNLIRDFNADARVEIWKKYLALIQGDRPIRIIDLRASLDGPNNGDYYYDTIHLNRTGSDKFTDVLADRIKEHAGILFNKAN